MRELQTGFETARLARRHFSFGSSSIMLPRRLRLSTIIAFPLVAATLPGGVLQAQLNTPLGELVEEFRWRSVGPVNMGGRVTDVEGIPGPSKTFYVAAAAGGIWKTTNNGTTFQQIWTDERVVSMGDIAIAPSNPDVIWAGSGEEDSRNSISPGGGIFKSEDGGETWELMGLEATEVIGRIVIHPTDPNIVHVAALGHIWGSNPERGLYRTRDGGETWELVKFISETAGFVDVVMDPRDPDRLFAASWERVRGPYFLRSGGPGSGLWLTEDGGDTWTEVTGDGFPTAEKGRIGLAMAPSNPDVMYAMVEARGEGETTGNAGNGLYRSTDGGATWEKRNSVNTRPFYYSQVRVDPQDENRVYFSSTPVRYSDDGGETYGTTTNAVHVDHHAMWIDPNDPERIVVGNDGGVAISYDKGGNWDYLNTMALGQFYDISLNMDTPYRICGGLQDNGTWCGPSRVANGQISKYHWATISGGDGFVTAQDPVDHDIVWSESQGGNMGRLNLATRNRTSIQRPNWRDGWLAKQDTIVLLTEDGAAEDDPRIVRLREEATRDSANSIMRFNWNTPFLQSAHDREWFYAAGNRVMKSEDRGDDLRIISPDLSYADAEKIAVATETTGGITPDVTGAEAYATVVALDESPLMAGKLFAGTDDGRVWMTEDDGADWTELTGRFEGVPAGTYVSRIKASNHDVNRIYVAFDNHRTNDFTPYAYVSDDNGASFRSISSNLPTGKADFVHVIEEDPVNPHLLFVGTDVGAYVSTDRGAVWQRFMHGMPAVPVHDLEVHPRDKELVAGTHGRSIWVVGIAALQGMTSDVIASGGMFAPAPPARFRTRARGGESTGQRWWSRPSPGTDAVIEYYLSESLVERGRDMAAADLPEDASPRDRVEANRLRIEIKDESGEVVRTLGGQLTAGLHRVGWNLRGMPEEVAETEPSPYEERERERLQARAEVLKDSLLAEEWDEADIDRVLNMLTQRGGNEVVVRGGGGGGGGGSVEFGDAERFQERPGESPPGRVQGRGGAGGGFAQMREIAQLLMPGSSMSQIMGRFRSRGGGGGPAPVVEPGVYTISLAVADTVFVEEIVIPEPSN